MITQLSKTPDFSTKERDTLGIESTDHSEEDFQQKRSTGVKSTFDAGVNHHLYRPIDTYEGIHRWDPDFEWTENEEKRIVRKVWGYLPNKIILSLPFCKD